jgi:2,5-diketo-D-gluconate reductase A
MAHPLAPTVAMAHGPRIPLIGLGTWPMQDDETADAVAAAVEAGYRLFDTAENYGNEAGVGEGIRRSGVARDDVFITTKFNKEWHSYDGAHRAFDASAARLGVEYIDLLLIHWPNPGQDRYVEAFQGLTALLDAGKVRAIGTSNFKPAHLKRLIDEGLTPHLNQIQLDPEHTRADIRQVHAEYGIVTEAWSPLGRGGPVLDNPLIVGLAAAYQRTPSQIVLRWHTQQGIVATPKSSDIGRQKENISIFDFHLTPEEIDQISALDTGAPVGLDADEFGH